MTVVSTPACNRRIAAVCLSTCGVSFFVFSDGQRSVAWAACLARRLSNPSGLKRRPDLVLYLNGIAIAVIELKRSSIEVADGVRQLITNQEEIFNKAFFATVQLVFAGSDSEGQIGRA